MNNDISFIIEIQKIDGDLLKIEEAREKALRGIKEAEENIKEKELSLQKLEEELLEIEKKSRIEELNIKTYEEKINKMIETQKLIKTNKEYNAMQKATKDAENLKAKCEEDLLSYLNSKDNLNNRISEMQKEIEGLSESVKAMQNDFGKSEIEFKKTKSDCFLKRELISSKVNLEYFKTYEYIKRSKKFPVITAVAKSGACTGCYRVLPPQQYNELLSESAFMQCPVCSRIIYIEEEILGNGVEVRDTKHQQTGGPAKHNSKAKKKKDQ